MKYFLINLIFLLVSCAGKKPEVQSAETTKQEKKTKEIELSPMEILEDSYRLLCSETCAPGIARIIVLDENNALKNSCMAVVLKPRTVLTTSHCQKKTGNKVYFNYIDMAGKSNLFELSSQRLLKNHPKVMNEVIADHVYFEIPEDIETSSSEQVHRTIFKNEKVFTHYYISNINSRIAKIEKGYCSPIFGGSANKFSKSEDSYLIAFECTNNDILNSGHSQGSLIYYKKNVIAQIFEGMPMNFLGENRNLIINAYSKAINLSCYYLENEIIERDELCSWPDLMTVDSQKFDEKSLMKMLESKIEELLIDFEYQIKISNSNEKLNWFKWIFYKNNNSENSSELKEENKITGYPLIECIENMKKFESEFGYFTSTWSIVSEIPWYALTVKSTGHDFYYDIDQIEPMKYKFQFEKIKNYYNISVIDLNEKDATKRFVFRSSLKTCTEAI